MKQGITFKQPFRKSLTFRNVFYSVLMLCLSGISAWLLSQFKFDSFSWQFFVAYISFSVLLIEFVFFGFSLFLRSNYVVLYNDRLVCINRFFPFRTNTYHFTQYQDFTVLIYTKSPYAHPMGSYAMICFCAPNKKWWKMRDYQFIASVSADDCMKLARLLVERGIDVKIYNNK